MKDFHEIYEAYRDDIRVTAMNQKVPGLDYDDVVSEMTIMLWKATKTYRTSVGRFGPYWWSLWLNRKYDLTRTANRDKRFTPVLVDDFTMIEAAYEDQHLPQCPVDASEQEQLIWDLLAVGDNAKEAIERSGVSKRSYYQTIRGWQTEEVWDSLV